LLNLTVHTHQTQICQFTLFEQHSDADLEMRNSNFSDRIWKDDVLSRYYGSTQKMRLYFTNTHQSCSLCIFLCIMRKSLGLKSGHRVDLITVWTRFSWSYVFTSNFGGLFDKNFQFLARNSSSSRPRTIRESRQDSRVNQLDMVRGHCVTYRV